MLGSAELTTAFISDMQNIKATNRGRQVARLRNTLIIMAWGTRFPG